MVVKKVMPSTNPKKKRHEMAVFSALRKANLVHLSCTGYRQHPDAGTLTTDNCSHC
jgi:hypothetical protein